MPGRTPLGIAAGGAPAGLCEGVDLGEEVHPRAEYPRRRSFPSASARRTRRAAPRTSAGQPRCSERS
jgi:hypothetical protein